MPVHDWTKPDAGLFHHFHQRWAGELCDSLNSGVLPETMYALVEQKVIGVEPDVMTLSRRGTAVVPSVPEGGIAVAESPPKARHVSRPTAAQSYAALANSVGIRSRSHDLIAVVEIVSPGNKDRPRAVTSLAEKTRAFLARGVHVLVIDLFPPSPRDPNGIHREIWDEIADDDYIPPSDRPLTLVSYAAAPDYTAYVEPVGVGEALPSVPLFLDRYSYVPAPLEVSYMRTWEKAPSAFREMVSNPGSTREGV